MILCYLFSQIQDWGNSSVLFLQLWASDHSGVSKAYILPTAWFPDWECASWHCIHTWFWRWCCCHVQAKYQVCPNQLSSSSLALFTMLLFFYPCQKQPWGGTGNLFLPHSYSGALSHCVPLPWGFGCTIQEYPIFKNRYFLLPLLQSRGGYSKGFTHLLGPLCLIRYHCEMPDLHIFTQTNCDPIILIVVCKEYNTIMGIQVYSCIFHIY